MQKYLDFRGDAGTAGGPLKEFFHPAVAAWFTGQFGTPTEVQRQAWAVTSTHKSALIAAPTGSGKTLAAFLSAINDLVLEGLGGGLEDSVHVLYVSPLKALSNDIQKNLQAPLRGIRAQLLEQGYADVAIRDAVRTGDTTQSERERIRRNPPHILVTTPESLFILLTSDSGRAMLSTVRSVIVDELHAVAGSKRGAHLMLSLERLDALCGRKPLRIGLSATVKPIEKMAEFLVGREPVEIVDTGHIRERDLALEVPRSPLDAVMANEVWTEVYDRLAELVGQHRTTLIFVNQRRLAERAARHLAERIGEEHVTAHHGSLAKEHRLDAEQRLKGGKLKALVATSALELGIDIGEIDLVCQLGSPRSIAAFLQRVGRAGHAVGAIPKGRLFPLTLDDLAECTALLDASRRGELDRILTPQQPLDVLAQQIVAEVGTREWGVTDLFETVRRATPYRDLARAEFDAVLRMLADGFSTRRGRRSAYVHLDAVNGRVRARRGAKLAAVTNAGVIPDQFDYDVVLSPEGHRIGTLNEDFSFESIPGDIFQLGNHSYRIQKVETGKVYVEDAKGQPPNMPFWLGEAPARTEELSGAVSRLYETVEEKLGEGMPASDRYLTEEIGLPAAAAKQLTQYLATAKAALSTLPNRNTVVFERFFDEIGDTHLVIHSPFGSRINRAWGLALRKRFCRQFNFELQASALEDSIVLSLGPSHSFPLETVQDFLKSKTVRELLIQALLDAPMFGTRWRWNASIALAVRRMSNGRRRPPQFQRSDSEDLLTAVFPDQLACAENLQGDREVPDHPLVKQTIEDCLNLTMDIQGLERLLERIERGDVRVVCRDLTAPSPLSQAVLNARPYAFLDDGAAEERRTRAVHAQRRLEPQEAADLGQLDPASIAAVCEDAWPDAATPDELHDALCIYGFVTAEEGERRGWQTMFVALAGAQRATQLSLPGAQPLWVAAERLHEFTAIAPDLRPEPPLNAMSPVGESGIAVHELMRSRLELLGPVTAEALAAPLGLETSAALTALLALEAEGGVMRGAFSGGAKVEWCDRRLLLRIHRHTTERKRAEIQPVAPAEFMRFLLYWQGLGEECRESEAGLLAALQQLEGFAVPAGAWETDILPARVQRYLPQMLDKLCAAGRIVWWRPASADDEGRKSGPVRSTPIVLIERQHLAWWQELPAPDAPPPNLSGRARRALESLRAHGASFFGDLVHDAGLLRAELEEALAELVSHGLVNSDSFAGLRALIAPARPERAWRRGRSQPSVLDEAGRWSLPRVSRREPNAAALADPAVEHVARVLLKRYGVVFRRLLEREDHLPPWRELFYVYRRMEARGEIRGGRFVSGFSGEQFALPEAAAALRRVARQPSERLISVSAADPLNLLGIVLPGERVAALPGNRLLFRDGKVVAVQSGGEVRYLEQIGAAEEWDLRNTLLRQGRHAAFMEQPAQPH